MIKNMDRHLTKNPHGPFNVLKFDTCANTASVISESQFLSYCHQFVIRPSIWPVGDIKVTGIGLEVKVLGSIQLQIQFNDIHLFICVYFLVLKQQIPTLLSLRDMMINGLDISLKNCHVSFGNKTHKLSMENYFLVHRWSSSDTPIALYTQTKLRRIHKSFGHPPVGSLTNLIKRADSNKLDKQARDSILKIAED